ncbi:MAG: methyltransferase domain-containing protein [Candidatus Pacearchaeota archaeon]|nr:methyltransferase domain-containing protein [Candidatus Pacearchaeota archaeon]
MKTDYSSFKVGTVFNPITKTIRNNFPLLNSVEISFPSRLNAMAIDPSQIAQNRNMVYTAGEIVFSIPIFKNIKMKVIPSSDCIISENSKRKSLIKHAFLIMREAIGFANGLYIEVDNSKEIKHQGMGSSSGLLAGVCAAINEIYGCPLSPKNLLRYVAQNHGEEIEGNEEELIPVQCIGGSAASGLYEGGALLLLGKNIVAKSMYISEEYSVVLGFPKDFKEIDSEEAMEKELENMERFMQCGKKYGKINAYNVLHKFIPAMIESDLEVMGDVIYDYRFNMGSIKNCSFLYPRLIEICNNISILKKENIAPILSISSVGPSVFAITKDTDKCKKIFEKENLQVKILPMYNGKYKILNSTKCEDVFWSEQSNFFSNKMSCPHIINALKKIDKGDKINLLDVGCGGGRNLVPAIEEGFEVYGLDYSESMLEKTRKKLEKYLSKEEIGKRIFKMDIKDILTIHSEFDVVLASGAIHQAKSREELKEIVRTISSLVKKGGMLIGNIFTSTCVSKDINNIDKDVYITKEGLYMTLFSRSDFLKVCEEYRLLPICNPTEEIKDVGTGDRSILRFELRKI